VREIGLDAGGERTGEFHADRRADLEQLPEVAAPHLQQLERATDFTVVRGEPARSATSPSTLTTQVPETSTAIDSCRTDTGST
jgi:hypothetical protein